MVYCGNGILEPDYWTYEDAAPWGFGEECDDGNRNDSDGCLSDCRLPRCGDDRTWDGHEECDGQVRPCTTSCGRSGAQPCGGRCAWGACGEACNGLDDDCDGETDEGAQCPAAGVLLGAPLLAVSGVAADDVWAVGERGTILHWDGNRWWNVPSGTAASLVDVWAGTSTNVWAVGDQGIVLRWDGSGWTAVAGQATDGASRLWGLAPDDIWVLGAQSRFSRWNGRSWDVQAARPEGAVSDFRGTAANELWAVGSSVFHWDGSAWSVFPEMNDNWFEAVWSASPRQVWAVGWTLTGPIVHWNGTCWSTDHAGERYPALLAVWGLDSSDVWAVGEDGRVLHRDAAGWSEQDRPIAEDLRGVWGSAADDVWAVGGDRGAVVVHWDGARWSVLSAPP